MNRKLDDTSCHLAMFPRNRILASVSAYRFLLLFKNYSKMNRATHLIVESININITYKGELVDDRNGHTANSAGID